MNLERIMTVFISTLIGFVVGRYRFYSTFKRKKELYERIKKTIKLFYSIDLEK